MDDLDGRMRGFESALDPAVLPGMYMVARLDGRTFTRLTKELHPFETSGDQLQRPLGVAEAGLGALLGGV